MKRLIGIIMAVWLLASTLAHASTSTSYLLISGTFGPGGAMETYKWEVIYPTGDLITGQDLLNTIFGSPPPVATGTYSDPTLGTYPSYTVGNSSQGAEYLNFGGGDFFTVSFTLNSAPVATIDDTGTASTLGWNYYVAGGSGTQSGDTYANNGAWIFSNDGQTGRVLQNGSFDGWVYGDTGTDPNYDPVGSAVTIDGTDDAPEASNFAAGDPNFAIITFIPEPDTWALLAVGAAGVALATARRRRRAL